MLGDESAVTKAAPLLYSLRLVLQETVLRFTLPGPVAFRCVGSYFCRQESGQWRRARGTPSVLFSSAISYLNSASPRLQQQYHFLNQAGTTSTVASGQVSQYLVRPVPVSQRTLTAGNPQPRRSSVEFRNFMNQPRNASHN